MNTNPVIAKELLEILQKYQSKTPFFAVVILNEKEAVSIGGLGILDKIRVAEAIARSNIGMMDAIEYAKKQIAIIEREKAKHAG